MSCPQACIKPHSRPSTTAFSFEAKGTGVSSVMGRASISPLIMTTGPGLPPRRMPRTPVPPIPVRTSRPSFSNQAATMAGRPLFLKAELGVGVDVAPDGDELGGDPGRRGLELRVHGFRRRRCGSRGSDGGSSGDRNG